MADAPAGDGAKGADRARQMVRIVLLPDQRERVKELTGRDVEIVELRDPKGNLARKLPGMRPPQVELLAIRKAQRLNAGDKAQYDWLVELAKAQDEDAQRAAKVADFEAELEKDIAKEQKRVAAEFKLLAAGEAPPKKGGKASGKKKRKAAGADDEPADDAPAKVAAKAPTKRSAAAKRKRAAPKRRPRKKRG